MRTPPTRLSHLIPLIPFLTLFRAKVKPSFACSACVGHRAALDGQVREVR